MVWAAAPSSACNAQRNRGHAIAGSLGTAVRAAAHRPSSLSCDACDPAARDPDDISRFKLGDGSGNDDCIEFFQRASRRARNLLR
jgi:hypothetical protein